MANVYTTGTINLVAGSKAVTGVGTAWVTSVIAGGVIYADGKAVPIDTVNSNTSITLAINWTGATGSYAYAIFINNDKDQIRANSTALATYIARLDNAALSSFAALGQTMAADKFAYATGTTTMAWATLTSKARELLAVGTSAEMRTVLDAQSKLGYVPVNKAGDVMSGALELQYASPTLIFHYPNVTRTSLSTDTLGNLAWRTVSDGDPFFYFNQSGALWTKQLGDIATRIDSRALAYANERVSQLAFRKVSRTAPGLAAGANDCPAGAVVTGLVNAPPNGMIYHYLQAYDPVRGWVNFTG